MGSNVFIFNPTAEMAIANGLHSYQAPELLQDFEREMATIMLFFATQNDVIVVSKNVSSQFIESIKVFKPDMPQFLTLAELRESKLELDELIPWSLSPAIFSTFSTLLPRFSSSFQNSPRAKWDDGYKLYYSRETAGKVLKNIRTKLPETLRPNTKVLPQTCSSVSEVEALLGERGSIVLKAPFSSSGRGIQMLRKKHLNSSLKAWIGSILEKQSFLMAEHLHEKLCDFSFHFKVLSGKTPEFLGTVFFNTNSNGQFNGCYIWQHPNTEYNEIVDHAITLGLIENLKQALIAEYAGYSGFIGVDAMLIKQDLGIRIHPCVEINPRHTMGLLTLKLRESISNSEAYWEMVFSKKGNIGSLLLKDAIALTPLSESTRFCAILHPNGKI